jgi:predicted nuclease of predicted toxin-antitoxin system
VKLLLDENLSPRLIEQLSDLYPGSAHVQECGLGSTDDAAIWELIWVRAGNCTSEDIKGLLLAAFSSVKRFIQEDEETFLILGPRHGNK